MSECTTGRDGPITAQAFATAITVLKQLPRTYHRRDSTINDMQAVFQVKYICAIGGSTRTRLTATKYRAAKYGIAPRRRELRRGRKVDDVLHLAHHRT
jgi:hypothetical protein